MSKGAITRGAAAAAAAVVGDEDRDTAELETLRRQMKLKERQMREQSEEINVQRQQLDTRARELDNIERNLSEREENMARQLDEACNLRDPSPAEPAIPCGRPSIYPILPEEAKPSLFQPSCTPGPNPFEPSVPRASLREAAENVPIFDGRPGTLTHFINACRRAREMVPQCAEADLTAVLINKIRGLAYAAVSSRPYTTITQLTDALNAAFGIIKNVDRCRGEISTLRQGRKESVLEYVLRAKSLHLDCIDAERRQHPLLPVDLENSLNRLATDAFCQGLRPEFRDRALAAQHAHIDDAFLHATALANQAARDEEYYGHSREARYAVDRNNEYGGRYPAPRRPPPTNYYNATRREYERNPRDAYRRDSPPHRNREDARYTNLPRDRFSPPPRAYALSRETQPKWCRYCKRSGHDYDECRTRRYQNEQPRSGNGTRPARASEEPRAEGPHEPRTREIRPIQISETAPAEPNESQ